MSCERLLAQLKHAAPGKAPLLERMCSSGFLSQIVSEHVGLGRQDPRFDSVQAVLQAGAPLVLTGERATNPKKARVCLAYANEMVKREERQRADIGLEKLRTSERAALMQVKAREFGQLLPPQRLAHVVQSRCSQAARAEAAAELLPRVVEPPLDLSQGFFGCGSLEYPFSVDTCVQALVKHLRLPALTSLECLPGFTSYSPVLRELSRNLMHIKDDGLLPTGLTFNYHETCWSKYFGLCGERDAGILQVARRLGSRLHASLAEGSFYKLAASRADLEGAPASAHVYVAFKRGRDPTLAVYCFCKIDGENGDLCVGIKEGQFRFVTHMELAKYFLVDEASAGLQLQSLSSALVSHTNIDRRFLRVRVAGYGEEDILFTRTRRKKTKEVSSRGLASRNASAKQRAGVRE